MRVARGGGRSGGQRAAARGFFPSCLLLLAFLAAGCATSSDIDPLKSTLTGVQVEMLHQKKDIEQIKTSFSDVSKDLSVLREQGFGAIRESQSSLLTQMGELSKELQVLRGRFDESKYFMDKSMKDLLSERELQQARMAALEGEIRDMKAKLTRLTEQGETAAAAKAREATPAQEPAPDAALPQQTPKKETEAAPNDPQRIYDDAQIDMKEKHYPEARHKFERFIKEFPKHTLTPNASFWVGESYYGEKKFEDAILAYESFLKRYPDHEKAKGAMLKQAYSFVELGDRKTGKVILERLIEKYPQSAEAELAERKIAEILAKNSGTARSSGKSKTKKR
ncbi:MAG: tol-pal system protein YbgF [Nitrospirales bacterium]|nr:tol-pal system protein YbgF [Nitrospirales bacterium]